MAKNVPNIVAMIVEVTANNSVFQAASKMISFCSSLVYQSKVNPFHVRP